MKRIGAVVHSVDDKSETAYLYVCEECGAVVNQVSVHQTWHDRLNRSRPVVAAN